MPRSIPLPLRRFAATTLGGAALLALLLALINTVWDWLENPGGIFRGPDGTDWSIVAETAWSWLGPSFLYGWLLFALAWLTGAAARRLWRRLAR